MSARRNLKLDCGHRVQKDEMRKLATRQHVVRTCRTEFGIIIIGKELRPSRRTLAVGFRNLLSDQLYCISLCDSKPQKKTKIYIHAHAHIDRHSITKWYYVLLDLHFGRKQNQKSGNRNQRFGCQLSETSFLLPRSPLCGKRTYFLSTQVQDS